MEARVGSADPSIEVVSNEEYDQLTSLMEVNQMPLGFRFHPTDEEIINHYLLNKVMDTRFAAVAIGEVDLNKCEPWDLPKKAKMGENEWFFYFQKDRKYATGMRSNRATESGYWKATGKDKEIYNKGKKCLVGMKKTLVFYRGRAPKGERTNWVMHEYRLKGNFSNYNFSTTAREEWVVCRVFHKKTRNETSPGVEVERVVDSFVDDIPTLPPLTDYSCSTQRSLSSSFAEEEEDFKANISSSKLMVNKTLQQLDQNIFFAAPNSHNQYSGPINNLNQSPMFYPQIVHPNLVFPYQSPFPSLANPISTNSLINGADIPADSKILAPNNYINIIDEAERLCKPESFRSFNNSIISHSHDSTGPGADQMATRITSLHSKGSDNECNKLPSNQVSEGQSFSPSISDLDSLWSY